MRLFGRIHVTVLGSLDQGNENTMEPRGRMRFNLVRAGEPCNERRGTGVEVRLFYGTLCFGPNTDYVLSRSNL